MEDGTIAGDDITKDMRVVVMRCQYGDKIDDAIAKMKEGVGVENADTKRKERSIESIDDSEDEQLEPQTQIQRIT